MKNIVLIGMPGTGKSTVGKALADRLGYDFVDTDDLIVQTTGKTLPEILRQDGLEAFYEIENKVGTDLNRTHTVIATGGSMVLYPEAMAHLKEGSTVIWLQTPFSQLEKRMPADLASPCQQERRCGRSMRSAAFSTPSMPTSSWPAKTVSPTPPDW